VLELSCKFLDSLCIANFLRGIASFAFCGQGFWTVHFTLISPLPTLWILVYIYFSSFVYLFCYIYYIYPVFASFCIRSFYIQSLRYEKWNPQVF
jgi:hypothetical protein